MRLRSASTQNSFPSLLSRARATGLIRPVVNRDSLSVPSRLAPSILAERSCTVVKYMYLQGGTQTHLYRILRLPNLTVSQLYSSNHLLDGTHFLLNVTRLLFCGTNCSHQNKNELTLSQRWPRWLVACRCHPSGPRPQCGHPSSGLWWCWLSHRSSKCGDCRGPGSGHEAGCPLAEHCCSLSWKTGDKHGKVINSAFDSFWYLLKFMKLFINCSLSHYYSRSINLHQGTVFIFLWSCTGLG